MSRINVVDTRAASDLPAGDLFKDRSVLFTGTTGFVGKVALSMLLTRYPDLRKVYVLVRKGSAPSAEDRFFKRIVPSEALDPIRDQHGDKADAFFREKCEVLDGDITDPYFGIDEKKLEELVGKVDVVINCAGLVSFDPSLELGINVNVHGAQYAVDLCKKIGAPLVHVSTCFVAGNRSGLVFEDESLIGYFPKRDELPGRDFSVDSELKDCERLVAQARERSKDSALTAGFRKAAIERLEAEGRDPNDEKAMRLALGRERKLWLTQELVRIGMERAEQWGWPNTYTYTKSLGEQVIARAEGLNYAIVRPSIVESALAFPFPGWNEGFTTSAPLTFMGIKGHQFFPAHDKQILDIIPVDLVCSGLLAVAGATIQGKNKKVYQLASSDSNPFYMKRVVELVGLYKRRFYRNKQTGNKTVNELLSKIEPAGVGATTFKLLSSPGIKLLARETKKAIEQHRPKWGMPTVDALLTRATEALDEIEYQEAKVEKITDLFLPFVWQNHYVFRCDNTRELFGDSGVLSEADKQKLSWDTNGFEWRDYWLDIHLPGLEKWVFPGLEEERKKKVHNVRTYRDLLELFEATTHAHKTRVAFRYYNGETVERFTFQMVDQYSQRVADYLLAQGVKKGDRVMLIGENRPEWPITYFGILRAGATVVPIDFNLTENEVVNLAKNCEATAVLLSEDGLEKHGELSAKLSAAGLKSRIALFAQAMAGDPAVNSGEKPSRVLRAANSDDLAAILYTSGTTGQPKGVMLTHRNFTSLVAKLANVYDLHPGDGVLSVLPLHHTFEFSCGLLLPFSRGAEVNYLDELTADRLGEALEDGRITGLIGVPALFQLLHRKITQELAAKPGFVEGAIEGLMKLNSNLRTKKDFNFGKLLFWPIHRKFGGKIRFMVSGASALPEEVHEAFHSLGFNISEGYGLTEAAPVLTVTEGGNTRQRGTVGRALPGIELRIDNPDAEGIGEVVARGPNIMVGYFGNREETDAVLKDGWLYTGDLGRLDEDGKLYLVGRKKDVIIDANGKNVYPDEIEELYRESRDIKEISVVGMPEEGGGEKVACLVVPEYGDEEKEVVRRRIEEHFRKVSASLPFYRRVKLLHFFDGEMEKTASRKIKRKWVLEQLKSIERASQSGQKAREAASSGNTDGDWLYAIVADVAQKPRSAVRKDTHLINDLGFDSLMMTELSVALEQAGVPLDRMEDILKIETMADLQRVIGSARKATGRKRPAETEVEEKPELSLADLEIPGFVADAGRKLLSLGQRAVFGKAFKVDVSGKAFIPQNRNFLVAANHTSHLDMGVIKVVLGEQGERLTALAARDYFFDTDLKRLYFENFSNLIPMEREGSFKESLLLASEALKQGYNLLIFPEGTRSADGKMADFKPTLGYLALQQNVDILPIWIGGAYDALPRGSIIPKKRELEVRIGPLLRIEDLRAATQGLARSQAYRTVTRIAEDAVVALRDGKVREDQKARMQRTSRQPKPAEPTVETKTLRGSSVAEVVRLLSSDPEGK